jgi:translation initiation factor 1A
MTRNIFGGKKAKKASRFKLSQAKQQRMIILKEEDQEYAEVTRILGDMRCDLRLATKQNMIGHIRGKMKKRCWINVGDIVLISFRDFQVDKCDIIHKYSEEESNQLRQEYDFNDEDENTYRLDTNYLEDDNDSSDEYQLESL